jgi:hypothetical protein
MRRRHYRKRPEPARREIPALIECHGVDGGPVSVTIGNETYDFVRDAMGRMVARVAIEDHIVCFLARSEMFRLAEQRL